AYLGALLATGDAAPADARGPGSQRGRTLPVLPVIRPPGALAEARFVERCDGCGACFDACPHGAIVALDARHGAVRGTPTIDARRAPCRMCADLPCISACDRGALVPGSPARIAVATIRQYDCLAYGGTLCSTCAERCPVPGAIERVAGKPRVVEDACTGCGVCQHVCPAPRNAILLVAPPERLEEPSA
ncbi:MAG: 4Fe-4S dicluster domain-containing protein, partial [Sandaracinaceae bacterium]|nr:4Fe-4S dicluster domain-containing protein [Sandaracinaceae bacterium]